MSRARFSVLFVFAASLGLSGVAPSFGQSPEQMDPEAYYEARQQASRLYEHGDWESAEAALTKLTAAYPGDGELWYRLGRARDQSGDVNGAIEAYIESLEWGYLRPAWTRLRVARLYAQRQVADSALFWLERALDARYGSRPGLAADTAFRALAGDDRFQSLMGQLPADLDRNEGWQYDIDYLVSEAHRMHVAGPGDPAVPAAFEAAAADLRARVPQLSNDEIVIELRRIVTLLGDGHTGIYGPDPDSPLEFKNASLPILFYLFDDGLFVIDAFGEAEEWIGSKVLSFGDMPVDSVVERLHKYTHKDNAMTVNWLGIRFVLPGLSFLKTIGATDNLRAATLTLQRPDSSVVRTTIEVDDSAPAFRRKLRPAPGRNGEPPAYLQRVDDNYWLMPIPVHDAVYFQFNQVRNEQETSLDHFADSLRLTLTETGASNLIIDVRHNNGGNNSLVFPLIQTLIWWEQDQPNRRIFVITGRNTFSASQNFINRVERWTDAIFVGEPSSSRPNFAGEETDLLLPYSRVRGSISNRYWQDSDQNDTRVWIAPDMPVRFTSSDYFGGRDSALNAILDVIGQEK